MDLVHDTTWTNTDRIHILEDLRPYVCIIEDCTAGEQLFASWRALKSHATLEHGKDSFISMAGLADNPGVTTCQLCRRGLFSQNFAARHLRQHMEELALFALPPSYRRAENDDPRQ
jgi:hypothetical protein